MTLKICLNQIKLANLRSARFKSFAKQPIKFAFHGPVLPIERTTLQTINFLELIQGVKIKGLNRERYDEADSLPYDISFGFSDVPKEQAFSGVYSKNRLTAQEFLNVYALYKENQLPSVVQVFLKERLLYSPVLFCALSPNPNVDLYVAFSKNMIGFHSNIPVGGPTVQFTARKVGADYVSLNRYILGS